MAPRWRSSPTIQARQVVRATPLWANSGIPFASNQSPDKPPRWAASPMKIQRLMATDRSEPPGAERTFSPSFHFPQQTPAPNTQTWTRHPQQTHRRLASRCKLVVWRARGDSRYLSLPDPFCYFPVADVHVAKRPSTPRISKKPARIPERRPRCQACQFLTKAKALRPFCALRPFPCHSPACRRRV